MLTGLAVWMGLNKTYSILLISSSAVLFFAFTMFLMDAKKMTLKTSMTFGPFLSVGALFVWFWPEIVTKMRMMP